MSELTKLLEGVKMGWQSLATVANIYDGTHQTPKYVEMGVPFVSVQNIKNLYATNKYISLQDFEKYKYKPQRGDIFMTRIGSIGSCAIVENDNPLAYYVTLTLIRVNHDVINSKYLKHIIESTIGQRELLKRTLVNATPIKINLGEIGKIQIPIPCPDNPEESLKIQQEIVRILDSLSEETNQLTAALQKELDLHQKRYDFYREELFKFEGKEVVWKSLAEVTAKTQNIKWNSTNKVYRYIDLSSVQKEKRIISDTTEISSLNAPSRAQKIILENDVIFATTRPTQMRVCLISNEFSNQIASTGFCVLRALEAVVLPKWIFHQLTSNYFKSYLEENQSGIAYPAISDSKVKEFQIPIPFPKDLEKSLQEQERIVKTLDDLDAKTQAITAAIQKEIALRNKQYEYYRDRLLSFPK